MNKNSLEELFISPEFPDYSVIVVDHLASVEGENYQDTLSKNLGACNSLLEASFIPFYLEKSTNKILCFLNYDHSSFSIRTFVGSLRQVLYTIGMNVHSYVFYSEELKNKYELQKELDFLLDRSYYGFLLGRRRPISGKYLHLCKSNTDFSQIPERSTVVEMLVSHEFTALSGILAEYGTRFANITDEINAFPLENLFECISDYFYTIKFYFTEINYSHSFFDSPLAESLIRYDGVSGIFTELSRVINDYSKVFSGIAVSERKHKHVEEMLEYIDNNLATVSLAGLSAKFDLTQEYICRLFKKEVDINFTGYLKQKRFEKAVELLKTNPNMTIASICDRIGLQGRSYFQNIFKKEYGMTPDAYRKEYIKSKIK